MTEQRVATLVVEVAGRKGNLESVLRALQSELRAAGSTADQTANQIGGTLAAGNDRAARSMLQLLQAADRAAQAQLRTAQQAAKLAADQARAAAAMSRSDAAANQAAAAAQRLAEAQAKAATAAQRLATEQARTEAAQTRAAATAQRLQQQQERAAQSARRLQQEQAGAGAGLNETASGMSRLGGAAAGLSATLGQLGIAGGVTALLAFADSARRAAVELERTEAVMLQLAGSQERYAEVVDLARQNQLLLGGSLNDNLVPLNAFLQLSNRVGVELDLLNQAAQLLVASAPGRTFDDASFSLSEFLSLNGAEAVLSLADRFNLSKSALAEFAAAGTSAEERLAGLFELLASQGVTQETLNASLTENAEAYNRLGIAASEAFTNIGSAAANAGRPVATFITGGLEGLNQLLTAAERVGAVNAQVFGESGGDYEAYKARIDGINSSLDGFGPRLQALSPAQFALAEALRQTGLSAAEAEARVRAGGETYDVIGVAIQRARGELDPFVERIAAVAASSDQAASDLLVLLASVDGTAAGTAAFNLQLSALETSLRAKADAEAAAARESQLHAALMDRSADAAGNAASLFDFQTQATRAQEQALNDAARAAFLQANAGGTMAQQARAAAEALLAAGNAGSAAAVQLGNSTAPIDRLTAAYYRLIAAQRAAGAGRGALGNLGDLVGAGAGAATAADRELLRRFNAGRLAVPPSRSGGGGGGGRGGRSEAAREQERLLEQERRFQEQRLRDQERINEELREAEQRHYEELLDIQREFEERSLEQQRENEVDKRRSRFDFYDDLTSSELPQDVQQQLSAAFEAAFAEASRLSQEGKAALANDYLALKQEQIQAEQQFQERLAQARKDGDKAELDRLQRLAELRRDAEREELQQLLAGGDENVNARDAALTEEQRRYAETQDAIAAKADEAAQRKIEASQRSLEQLQLETQELQRQADLLAATNRAALPGSSPATPPATSPGNATPAPAPPVPPDPATLTAVGEAAGQGVSVGIGPGLDTLASLLREAIGAIGAVEAAVRSLRGRANGPFAG